MINVLSPVLVGDSGIALEVVTPLSDADGLNGFQGTELGDDGLGGDSDSGLGAVKSMSGTVGLNGFRNIELGD